MSDMINLPVAEYQQLQAQKAEFEKLTAARELEAASANARLAISRGEIDSVVRQTRAEVADAKAKAASFAARSELATALAGHQLSTGSAEQLATILGNQITGEIAPDGTFASRTPTYQSVKDFVASKLAEPTYQHFLASGKPAAQSNPGNPAAPGASSNPFPQPTNFGQAITAKMHQSYHENRERLAAADPRSDMSVPFGLKAKR
jgi:hypothetical protein